MIEKKTGDELDAKIFETYQDNLSRIKKTEETVVSKFKDSDIKYKVMEIEFDTKM